MELKVEMLLFGLDALCFLAADTYRELEEKRWLCRGISMYAAGDHEQHILN